ncbi:enhancer of mRNA-decapping protein 4-like [Amphiura filiformis]|uniref:enhancer of mRNA-decapping protein 4-like n=1 Tax=Amphiura filiformis TaxID=82378 RepID=UPI003B222E05
MDSSLSTSGSLSAGEASQILKDLLNVGKSPGLGAANSTPDKMDGDRMENGRSRQSQETPPRPPRGATAGNGSFEDFGKVYQKIILEGDDKKGSVPIFGREVDIIPSAASSIDSQTPGSSKVKITPVVNYDWEHRYYYGNLVAVNTTYLVYVLKVHPGYGLRILNRRTVERALLKGFVDVITDVAFAHHNSNVLGCIDRRGNLSVWQIHEGGGKIQYTPKLNVTRSGTQSSDFHRLMWCPFLPDDPGTSDSSTASNEGSRMLAVTHDNQAELWDVDVATELYSTKPIEFEQVREGLIKVYDGHTKPITDASVSPDGTVLATSSLDGTVKFWQMYWEATDPPRRLHQFSPHDGKPVSALLFCDNHKYQDPNLPFWRFLITGADYNSELKVWCTVTWTCLQKLQLHQPGLTPQPAFKVKLDLSASFLIMTDIKRKVLYVIQLFQDPHEGRAHVTSISEFLLMQPMLSFAVVDAGKCKIKPTNDDGEDGEELNSGELDTSLEDKPKVEGVGVKVKMFCVNSRSVQDLQVRFQPSSSVDHDMGGSISSASQDDIALRDGLSDMSFNTTSQSGVTTTDSSQSDIMVGGGGGGAQDVTSSFTSESTHSPSQPYLMTPDAFTSKSLPPNLNNKSVRDSASSSGSSMTRVSAMGTSIDDLLGSSHTSSDSTRVITPDSSVTLTPSSSATKLTPHSHQGTPSGIPLPPMTPGEVPLPPMTPGEVPLPPMTPGERNTQEDDDDEEDEGPPSPPPSPVGCTTPEQLTRPESTDKISQLLAKARRMSESSAEVAQIMKRQIGEENEEERIRKMVEEMEDEEGAEGEKDTPRKPESSEDDEPPAEEESNQDDPSLSGGEFQGFTDDDIQLQEQRLAEMASKMPVDTPSDDPSKSNNNQQHPSDEDSYYGSPESGKLLVGRWSLKTKDASEPSDTEPDEANVNPPEPSQEGPFRDRGDQAIQKTDEESLSADELRKMFQQLWGVVSATKDEMLVLRRDFTKMQSSNSIIQSMKARIDKLDKSMGIKLEKSSEQERQRLTVALQEKQALDKQKQERLLETVSQTLKQSVTSRLDNTVKAEITNKVVPELQRVVAPVEEQINTTIAQKLTATDQLMRENISKLVKSRGVTEAMGQAAASALNNTIQSTYKDAFQNTVMPAFERSCQSMFAQINAAFDMGTREYAQQLEMHLSKIRKNQQGLVADFKTNSESMQTSIANSVQTHLAAELSETLQTTVQTHLAAELHKSQQTFEDQLLDQVRKMIKEELNTAMKEHHVQDQLLDQVRMITKEELNSALKEHQVQVQDSIAAVVRSQAPTPVPQAPDIQQIQSQIQQLLQRRQINAAFQMALSASDLRAVLFVCNALNAEELFSIDPCPMEQPVLLSLIQQLSHDLNNNTTLKCSYLEESLLAIDPRNDVTSEHLPRVIGDMVQRLTEFISANQTHSQRKTLRKVLLQAKALIK